MEDRTTGSYNELESLQDVDSFEITADGHLVPLFQTEIFVHSFHFPEEEDLSEFMLGVDSSVDDSKPKQSSNTPSEKPKQGHKGSNGNGQRSGQHPRSTLIDLTKSEVQHLEALLISHLDPYFSNEFTFIDDLPFQSPEIIKEVEHIHQKILVAIEKDIPITEETFKRLSYYYALSHRNYEGIKLIEHRLDQWTQKAFFYNVLGNFYFGIGNSKIAVEYFIKSVKENHDFLAPHFSLGYIYSQEKKFRKGFRHLKRVEKAFINNPYFLSAIGECCEAKESYDKALFYYEKYLYYRRNNVMIKKLAELSYHCGYHEMALNYFEQALDFEISIKNVDYKKVISFYYTDAKDKAIAQLAEFLNELSLAMDENQSEMLLNLLKKAYKLGIYDHYTFSVFESLTKELGLSYQDFLEKEIHPEQEKEPNLLLALAMQAKMQKRHRTCANYLKQILTFDKRHPRALMELAKIYYQYPKSRNKSIKLFSFLEKAKKTDGEIDFYLGLYYLEHGKLELSAKCFKRAISKNTENSLLYKRLGETLLKLGKNKQAKRYLQFSLDLDPNQTEVLLDLGKLCLKDKDYMNSIRCFKQVLKLDKDNKSAHLFLSNAYKLVLENESEEHYSKYIDLSN